MKANLKNALMIVAALLVAYVAAFFVTMKLEIGIDWHSYVRRPPQIYSLGHWPTIYARKHVPRWVTPDSAYSSSNHWHDILFAPLIWVEHHVRPPEYWEWKEGQPKPDWIPPEWYSL